MPFKEVYRGSQNSEYFLGVLIMEIIPFHFGVYIGVSKFGKLPHVKGWLGPDKPPAYAAKRKPKGSM